MARTLKVQLRRTKQRQKSNRGQKHKNLAATETLCPISTFVCQSTSKEDTLGSTSSTLPPTSTTSLTPKGTKTAVSLPSEPSPMDCHMFPVCSPLEKKRKLCEDTMTNGNGCDSMPTAKITCAGQYRRFLSIARSDSVFQTEDWNLEDNSLFLPLTQDLLINVHKVDQFSCTEGQHFVADASGSYSRTLSGKVIHLWRYDKLVRKLFISRSFLFTDLQEYLRVQRFLQNI